MHTEKHRIVASAEDLSLEKDNVFAEELQLRQCVARQ